RMQDPSKILLISINEEYAPIEVLVADIQELWQVNSKLTFSVDATSENGLLKQLQQSMEELKNDFKSLKK
ncbi:MAG: DNA-binding protein, partial [Gillisia sp.]